VNRKRVVVNRKRVVVNRKRRAKRMREESRGQGVVKGLSESGPGGAPLPFWLRSWELREVLASRVTCWDFMP
jgi:hypothetical protein